MASKKAAGVRVSPSCPATGPGGRPWEGVVDWDIDYARYTEWALLHRGYETRPDGWLTGYYHFNIVGVSYGGHVGQVNQQLDEDGFNEVCFVPIGDQANKWANSSWKNHHFGLWDWYESDEMRPYYWGSLLFLKNDVYVHTEPTSY